MGIPLHYRKGTDSKAYINNNMLIMHDNVYAMKIRHYQLIINNILTFWIENWLKANHKDLVIKYVNVNIPEFVPISERKDTDLDKASKFVTVFTQLEQMLGMKIKDEFILNTLFQNDIMSDIVDIDENGEVEQQEDEMADEEMMTEEGEEDIMSLFETSYDKLLNKSKKEQRSNMKLFSIKKDKLYSTIKYKLKLNVDW